MHEIHLHDELVIDLNVAKVIGPSVPLQLRQHAHEVIE